VEWWMILLAIFSGLFLLFAAGVPVGYAFLFVNMVTAAFIWAGGPGLEQTMLSIFRSVTNFSLLPLPLFILMGELIFNSGVADKSLDALDKWIGKVPGRLSMVAVLGGTVNATLSGSSMASTAMLSSCLYPEMEKRGYLPAMSIGPLLGSGGLATMIPPSNLGVILAALAGISVGDMLIAIVIPGFMLSIAYLLYIGLRCYFQPHLAPPYRTERHTLRTKLIFSLKYLAPLSIIVFVVIFLIYFGIATPTESSVFGVLCSLVLGIAYNGWDTEFLKNSLKQTALITGMMFIIICASATFSEILAFTGATEKLIETFLTLFSSPILVVISMQVVLFMMGMFLESLPIMMITVPIFWPILTSYHINPLWFAAIMLLNIELGMITPPFGLCLFAVKAVLPEVGMGSIYRCAVPIVLVQVIVIALLMLFPALTLWLPMSMHQ
jgi:tripartite ATP-independent transporter DctM subunit